MKKHTIRSFALIISLLLAASLALAACGRKSSTDTSGTKPADEASAQAEPKGDEVPEEEVVADLKDDESDAPASDFPEGSDGPVGDEEYTGPCDFLQEQSGKTEFKDYDEIISLLESGQGYAYLKLKGSDDDVLAITEKVEEDGTATDASVYGYFDGKLQELSTVGGYDTDHPLRLADGILYAGDDNNYESYFLSKENGGLMMKDYVMRGEDEGKVRYTGFLRVTNDFDHDKNFIGGDEEFEEMIMDRDTKPAIEFTKVK